MPMRQPVALLFAALTAFAAVGCNPPEDAETGKPAVAFEGKPDPRFVGTWKVTKGDSTYTFAEDGAFKMKGSAMNRGQKLDISTEGKWLVNDDRLLIQDARNNVVPYAHKLDGDKLTLALTGSMKAETEMVRQK